jgi:hypothetical protein
MTAGVAVAVAGSAVVACPPSKVGVSVKVAVETVGVREGVSLATGISVRTGGGKAVAVEGRMKWVRSGSAKVQLDSRVGRMRRIRSRRIGHPGRVFAHGTNTHLIK